MPPGLRRAFFDGVHNDFRASFRTFLDRHVVRHDGGYDEWEAAGTFPKATFALAGQGGFLAMAAPPATAAPAPPTFGSML
jgi:hypothetical protein